jgi:hypothetical protein
VGDRGLHPDKIRLAIQTPTASLLIRRTLIPEPPGNKPNRIAGKAKADLMQIKTA